MKKFITRALMLMTLVTVAVAAQAQNSRESIRNSIKGWGECRTVAITKTGGDAAIYGMNGYSYSQIPTGLANAIKDLHSQEERIQDIVLTENGDWVVLYGMNGARWSNSIPQKLKDKIIEYNGNNETITSIALNAYGEWAVVTDEHISASNDDVLNWLHDGCDNWGTLWTVCFDDDSKVAVYEKGYRYRGDVPQGLKDALKESDLDVYIVKVAGTSWFFADKDGSYRYHM